MVEVEPQVIQPMLAIADEETGGVFLHTTSPDYDIVCVNLMVPKDMAPGLTPRMVIEMYVEELRDLLDDPDAHAELYSLIPRIGSN